MTYADDVLNRTVGRTADWASAIPEFIPALASGRSMHEASDGFERRSLRRPPELNMRGGDADRAGRLVRL
jgi:hypothetical protein